MRAEPEFAFRMAADPGPEPSLEAVLDAVDTMVLALEMPDSRYADHRHAGETDLVADVACAGRFVEGRQVTGWRDLDLAERAVAAFADGVEFSRGSGELVLGDPRHALHRLAAEIPRYGHRLRPGDIVTTGAAAPAGTDRARKARGGGLRRTRHRRGAIHLTAGSTSPPVRGTMMDNQLA